MLTQFNKSTFFKFLGYLIAKLISAQPFKKLQYELLKFINQATYCLIGQQKEFEKLKKHFQPTLN